MPLDVMGGEPPPFFRQGPSAFSKLLMFSAAAVLLMVADVRFQVAQPLRATLATMLYPMQWVASRPALWLSDMNAVVESIHSGQAGQTAAADQRRIQSQKTVQVEALQLENQRLRNLFELRPRFASQTIAAQVIYDAADPYARKVVLDKGTLQGIMAGAPVVDERGVLGQVTRAYPLTSEVSLITNRDQATPVLNARTGARGVAFGNHTLHPDSLELRFMASNADVAPGDLLTTSGVDGVYPPGLPVARVEKIDRQADAAFALIYCRPVALVSGTSHVLVLSTPVLESLPRPPPDAAERTVKSGGKP